MRESTCSLLKMKLPSELRTVRAALAPLTSSKSLSLILFLTISHLCLCDHHQQQQQQVKQQTNQLLSTYSNSHSSPRYTSSKQDNPTLGDDNDDVSDQLDNSITTERYATDGSALFGSQQTGKQILLHHDRWQNWIVRGAEQTDRLAEQASDRQICVPLTLDLLRELSVCRLRLLKVLPCFPFPESSLAEPDYISLGSN